MLRETFAMPNESLAVTRSESDRDFGSSPTGIHPVSGARASLRHRQTRRMGSGNLIPHFPTLRFLIGSVYQRGGKWRQHNREIGNLPHRALRARIDAFVDYIAAKHNHRPALNRYVGRNRAVRFFTR